MPQPVVAVSDRIRFTIESSVPSQVGLNVLHYRVALVGGASLTPNTLSIMFDNLVFAAYTAWLANTATYQGIRCQVYAPVLRLEIFSQGNAGAGAGGLTCLPHQVCGLIKKATSRGGPSGRGRMYIPFGATDAIAPSGDLSLAGSVLLADIATAVPVAPVFTSGANSVTLQMILNAGALVTYDVTDLTASDNLATQRRRGNYGRTNMVP